MLIFYRQLARSPPQNERAHKKSENGQICRGVSDNDGAAILVDRLVADVMQTAFDGAQWSLASLRNLLEVPRPARDRRDELHGLNLMVTAQSPFANDSAGLFQAGPSPVILQARRGRKRPLLQVASPCVDRFRSPLFSSACSLTAGGNAPYFAVKSRAIYRSHVPHKLT